MGISNSATSNDDEYTTPECIGLPSTQTTQLKTVRGYVGVTCKSYVYVQNRRIPNGGIYLIKCNL